jgi:hypothetical protein
VAAKYRESTVTMTCKYWKKFPEEVAASAPDSQIMADYPILAD